MKFKDMNLPNKLTTIRMWCVPLMVVLFVLFMLFTKLNVPCDYVIFFSRGYLTITQILMVVVFAFASITDFVDGYLARKHNIVSDYGKLMDPLADKLLVNTTLICMMASGMFLLKEDKTFLPLEIVAVIMAIIVIARDIFVDALRMQALKSNAVVPANIWGKLKTATLMPGIVILLVGSINQIVLSFGLFFVAVGGIFALIGGIKYYIELSKYIGD